MSKAPISQAANSLWQKQPKANAELFALTYGALVGELVRDLENHEAIQNELDKMGHSIGIRCIEEFLAKSETHCQTFAESADLIKMAFKMYLGVLPETMVGEKTFHLTFYENPLALFVELPEEYRDLEYNQLLVGMVRGMMEMLSFRVSCSMALSQLKGDETNEMSVVLEQVLQQGAGEDYQEE